MVIYFDGIPLYSLLEVNHCSPLLNIYKNVFYINSTEKRMNQFAIGYLVNHTINVTKLFREQVGKCLKEKFHPSTMPGIRNVTKKIILVLLH